MIRNNIYLLTAAAALFLASCNNNTGDNSSVTTSVDTSMATNKTIILAPFQQASPEFENASLGIESIKATKLGNDSATVTIVYQVNNYELKAQTSDATTKGCNNSKDGQHIHFILNNEPYTALYEPKHTFNVALNKEYFAMNFLSRSYHESVKQPSAYQLLHFMVDDKGAIKNLEIPNTPMVFFSRPKGDYVGKENTDKVLLDFYVVNTNFESHRIEASLNGQSFIIDKWQPYFIENAPMGPLDVNLKITNLDGVKIEGPNTDVSRTATLATAEPVR